MNEEKIKMFIIEELSKFKFQKYTKGYKYLIEVIYLAIIDVDAIENLSKNIFPIVANKFSEKTWFNVKWCIDKVIQTMYNNTNMNIISEYFGLEYNIKPSLKYIVYTVVCKFNRNIK